MPYPSDRTHHLLNHSGMPIKPQKLRDASSDTGPWKKVTTKTCSILCFVPHIYGCHKSLSFIKSLNLVTSWKIVSSSHSLLQNFLKKLGNQRVAAQNNSVWAPRPIITQLADAPEASSDYWLSSLLSQRSDHYSINSSFEGGARTKSMLKQSWHKNKL